MEKFRLLNADEIECKVKKVTEKGAILLLYKTARTDMDLLDEAVGPENWTDDYKEIKGNLYCGIALWDDGRKEWIWKWDCGIESREDGEGNEKKGEASDSFKRAGFRWGIGRELYTAPFIWIPADRVRISEYKGKLKTDDKFSVKTIGYDEKRRISKLEIFNDSQHISAFAFGTGKTGAGKKDTQPQEDKNPKCEECSNPIVGYKGAKGKDVTPEQHIAYTQKEYGKSLCLECARKAKAAKEAEAE